MASIEKPSRHEISSKMIKGEQIINMNMELDNVRERSQCDVDPMTLTIECFE